MPHFKEYDYYDEAVSAGIGNLVDNPEKKKIKLTKKAPSGTTFLTKITGDSMEPTFFDGDIIFIDARPGIQIGEIGIFCLNHNMYIKELGEGCLISHNRKYKNIVIQPDDFIVCQGKVIGKCDDLYIA